MMLGDLVPNLKPLGVVSKIEMLVIQCADLSTNEIVIT
jgi:hypothetical protein